MTDIVISSNSTTKQTLPGAADTLTVNAGISLSPSGNPAVDVTAIANGVTITNFGTISSTGTGNRAIRFEAKANGETNARTFTVENKAGATITSQNDAINLDLDVKSGTIVVNNAGMISATGVNANNGQAIDFAKIVSGTASVTINNLAGGVIQTADADAIRTGNGTTVNNAGQITANNYLTNSGADGLDFQAGSGTVHNYAGGTISGGRHGINDGTGDNPTANIMVTNDAGATLEGRNGSGVGGDGNGTVVNHGNIFGRYDGVSPNGDGDGVDLDYIGHITNDGRIEGTGAAGVGSDGFTNVSQGIAIGGGTVDNLSGGIIKAVGDGIFVDDSHNGPAHAAIAITNAGSIEGTNGFGIKIISTFANTVTNSGSISGGNGTAIQFGDGSDTLIVKAGSVIAGLVDGGAGADLLTYDATAGASSFVRNGDGSVTVSGPDGSVTLAHFEQVHFTDATLLILDNAGGSAAIDAADTILGGAGNDSFTGVAGTGVAGGHSLVGGGGADLLDLGNATAAVQVNLGAGTAKGSGLVDRFSGIHAVQGGAGFDSLLGSTAADSIMGGGGNDTLQGLQGHDVLGGGTGNDTFLFRAQDFDTGGGIQKSVLDFAGAGKYQVGDNDFIAFVNFGAGSSFAYQGPGGGANQQLYTLHDAANGHDYTISVVSTDGQRVTTGDYNFYG